MGNIIYGKLDPSLSAVYGNYVHPIKMLLEDESNAYRTGDHIVKTLYNEEKSANYAETTTAQTDFDIFSIAREGQGAENDTIGMGFNKTIFHHQFMKEFTITAEMMEDAKMGVATEMKRRATKFIRAYEKTRSKLAAAALYNGTATKMIFGKGEIDLSVGDGLALFSNAHKFAKPELSKKTQSNYFSANIANDISALESTINVAASTMRSFKDENGEALGYYPNVIVIPGNRYKLEAMVRKVCGSERTTGSANNDINIQYGNWNIIVIPEWETTVDTFILESTEANKQLFGSAFFDRTKLTVNPWVDHHTGNFVWTGRARMGIGHNTWKHAAMVVDNADTASGTTKLII